MSVLRDRLGFVHPNCNPLALRHYRGLFRGPPGCVRNPANKMYLVAIAWMYVVLMAALVEALSTDGTVVGAIATFLFFGLLPLGIVMYLLGTPSRRRARHARERDAQAVPDAASAPPPDPASAAAVDPHRGGHPAGDAVSPKREEP